ncbi:putative RNA polymerase sigma-I factor [Hollandina sp. SP2]
MPPILGVRFSYTIKITHFPGKERGVQAVLEEKPVLPERSALAEGTLEARLALAKTDKHVLNTLLHDYMPFIKKCLSAVFFKGQSKADNLTDAMLAFARSVQTYNREEGAFIPYAATVIRNRLIDRARKEQALQKHLFSLPPKADETSLPWETGISLQAFDRAEEARNLRLEIEAVNREFARWGFSWATLLKKCPKQERSRRICQDIAKTVQQSSELLDDTLKARRVPITRLAEAFPRKALETYRQYIAALIILSQGDYPYVYSFVPQSFNEEE